MRIVYFFLCFVMVSCVQKGESDERFNGEPIPSFNILLTDSLSMIHTDKISNSGPIVLIFFDPYCMHCAAETESIVKNITKLKQVKFCFLSIASMKDVRFFYHKYNMGRYDNIIVGVDTGFAYMKHFGVTGVPHTTIYTKNRRLTKVFLSEITASQLLSEI